MQVVTCDRQFRSLNCRSLGTVYDLHKFQTIKLSEAMLKYKLVKGRYVISYFLYTVYKEKGVFNSPVFASRFVVLPRSCNY